MNLDRFQYKEEKQELNQHNDKCDMCGSELPLPDCWMYKNKRFCTTVCLIKEMADWGEEDIADYVACILLNHSRNAQKRMERIQCDFNNNLTIALRREFFEWPDDE